MSAARGDGGRLLALGFQSLAAPAGAFDARVRLSP